MISGILTVIKDGQKARIKIKNSHSQIEFVDKGFNKPTTSFQLEMIKLMDKLNHLT